MLKFCRNIVFLSLIGFLLFSYFPSVSIAEELSSVPDHEEYVELLKEAEIHIDDQVIVGKFHEGTQIRVESMEEGKVYFHWGNDIAYTEEENVKRITDSEAISFLPVEFVVDEAKERILTHVPTEVYVDTQFDQILLTLAPEAEFDVTKAEGDEHYIFTFGDQTGVIKATTVELISSDNESQENEVQTVEPSVKEEMVEQEVVQSVDVIAESTLSTNLEMEEAVDVSSNETNTFEVAQFSPTDRFFEVMEDRVSIYDNSTGTLQVVGFLNKGQEYPRVADYGADWHQIKYRNGYGYIWKPSTRPSNGSSIHNLNPNLRNIGTSFKATDRLSVYDNSSGSLVPFAALHKNTIYPVIGEYGDWYQIDVSGRIGFVYKPATIRTFKATDRYFIPRENLTVFDNSTGALVPIGELNFNEAYPRVSDWGDWHQIKFGNRYGYVWKDSTNPLGPGWIKNENKLLKNNPDLTYRTIGNVTVYDNTSGSLVPFGVIYKGTVNQAIQIMGDWLQIDFAGRVGYIAKSATQIGPIYQYEFYDKTLDQMWQKQLTVGNLTDKQYQTYVRSDALRVENEVNPAYGDVVSEGWNVRGGPGASYWQVGVLNLGEGVNILNKVYNQEDGYWWYEIKFDRRWKTPNPEDVKYYLNPDNARPWTKEYYQFLSLSQSAGVGVQEVNEKILVGKGILEGKAQAFIQAANVNNMNEIYLISHALLETGHGTSQLATGVLVSEVNGQPVEPRIVYNMFGIHAYDSAPLQYGSEYAYQQGWFTPEDAIIGGAKWIGDGYINDSKNRQDTLYKMKWNPAYPATGNYASDIGWAYKQVNSISNLYSLIDSYILIYNIPVYKK